MSEKYPGLLLNVHIPESIRFAEAPEQKLTIFEHDASGDGAAGYASLAEVILNGSK